MDPENEKLVVCGNTSSKEEEHNQPAGVGQLGPRRRREISLTNTVTPVSARDWKQLDENDRTTSSINLISYVYIRVARKKKKKKKEEG